MKKAYKIPATFKDVALINCSDFRVADFNSEEKLYIRDLAEVKRKLQKLRQDGMKNVHVLSDFDRTFTTFKHNGINCETTFSFFRRPGLVSTETLDLVNEPFLHTQKLESRTAPYHYIVKAYQKRTEEALQKIVDMKITKESIENEMKHAQFLARNGLDLFLAYTMKNDIRLSIASSGILNIIIAFLYSFIDINAYANLKMYGNVFTFAPEGYINDFKKPVISPLTKSKIIIREPGVNDKNVFLLGDQLHDVHLAKSLKPECSLKYGFYNSRGVSRIKIEEYGEKYDITTGDGNFFIPLMILRYINREITDKQLDSMLEERMSAPAGMVCEPEQVQA